MEWSSGAPGSGSGGGYATACLYLSQFVTAGVAGARPGAVSALILPRIGYLRDINGIGYFIYRSRDAVQLDYAGI